MWRRSLQLALLSAVALSTGACEYYYNKVPSPDDLMHAIPWFDHMIHQKSISPYASAAVPRNTPPGTVPVTGGEPDWETEWRTGNTTTADRLVNPLRAGAAGAVHWLPGADVPNLRATPEARGDTLYNTFCIVCHGPDGNADGTVTRRIGAPSLLTARARALSDGFIYSMIRYGRGVMPRYGDKIYRPDDRWAVVNYVRHLQAQAPAPADTTGGKR